LRDIDTDIDMSCHCLCLKKTFFFDCLTSLINLLFLFLKRIIHDHKPEQHCSYSSIVAALSSEEVSISESLPSLSPPPLACHHHHASEYICHEEGNFVEERVITTTRQIMTKSAAPPPATIHVCLPHNTPQVRVAESPLVIDHDVVIDQAENIQVVERSRLAKVRVSVTKPLSLAHELTQCENTHAARQMPAESVAHCEPYYKVTDEALDSSKSVIPNKVSVFNAARSETEHIQAQETKYMPPAEAIKVELAKPLIQSPRARSQPISSSITYAFESTTRLADEIAHFEEQSLTETVITDNLEKLDSKPTRPVKLNLPACREEINAAILPPRQFQTPEVITESLETCVAARTVLESPAKVVEPLKISRPVLRRLSNEILSTEALRGVDKCDNHERVAEKVEFEPELAYADVTEHKRVNIMPTMEIAMHEASTIETEMLDEERVRETREQVEFEKPCDWHKQTVFNLAQVEKSEPEKTHAFFVPHYEHQREEICMTQEIVSLGSSLREVSNHFSF
jgi:hypothetical protein